MAVKQTIVEPTRAEIAAATAREIAHFAELLGAAANADALAEFTEQARTADSADLAAEASPARSR